MKEYVVYFDVFGKKLKTTVKAKTPEKAAQQVRESIDIIKIEETKSQLKKDFIDELMEDVENSMKNLFKKK